MKDADVVYSAKNDTHKLVVRYDKLAENPREWSNLGTMVCFHGRYALGDEHGYETLGCFLRDLVISSADELTDVTNEVGNELCRELYYYWKENGDLEQETLDILNLLERTLSGVFPAEEIGFWVHGESSTWLEDMLSYKDTLELLNIIGSLDKYIILPLYHYDHSSITMSTNRFSCPWGSSQVGWIYASKQRFLEETGYIEAELFSADSKRKPFIGEHVKVKGRDGWGTITESVIAPGGLPGYKVDFDYNKALNARKQENLVIVPRDEITEVMANRAIEILVNEVKTYDMYLRGDCYYYDLRELLVCEACGNVSEEFADSCGGFLADSLEDLQEQIKGNLSSEFHDLVDSLEGRY